MLCLCDALRKYLELVRPCGSRRQWQTFVTVLLGLIEHAGRPPLTGRLACGWATVCLPGRSRFLGRRPWAPAQLAQTWSADCRQTIAPAVEAAHRRWRAERPTRCGRAQATLVTGALLRTASLHRTPKGRSSPATAA